MFGIINIFIFIFIFIGLCVLQIFLSKMHNKWLGLIIPGIFLLFSIFACIAMPLYSITETTTVTESHEGSIIHEETTTSNSEHLSILAVIGTIIPIFLIFNIPTLIFLGIYGVCREKTKRQSELDRMNVLDLE